MDKTYTRRLEFRCAQALCSKPITEIRKSLDKFSCDTKQRVSRSKMLSIFNACTLTKNGCVSSSDVRIRVSKHRLDILEHDLTSALTAAPNPADLRNFGLVSLEFKYSNIRSSHFQGISRQDFFELRYVHTVSNASAAFETAP